MSFNVEDIKHGFKGDQFYPVFQPLCEVRTGKLVGFEILARWKADGIHVITPDQFIPALERHDLIDELTESLLAQALRSRILRHSRLTLAVNLSPSQLNSSLPERLDSLIGKYSFPPHRLTIEITESALANDLDRAAGIARTLKSMGFRLALDDFGTGYSSLTHLHALPFDQLKVDRSFVRSMLERRESRKIVASVVGLGQSLGLLTVAEGVETREQAEMLFCMGCELGQGWWYGGPVSIAELPSAIREPLWSDKGASSGLEDSSIVMSLEAIPSQRLAQLQAIYDGAPVGLCYLDRQMRYVSLNLQLAKLNNFPAPAHLGRTVAEVVPEVFPRAGDYIRHALNGEAISGIKYVKPPNAHRNYAQTIIVSYQPVRDESNEVLGVSVAILDATRRA